MKKYTLLLKKLIAQSAIPIFSFEVYAQNNMLALLDGEKCVCNFLGSEDYELIDAGMLIGDDTTERMLTFIKNEEIFDFILNII